MLSQEKVPLYQALKNGIVTTKQISIVLKNGNKRVVKGSGSQIKDDNGIVYGAVVSMHDVAEQNKFEELLAFNEKCFR